LAPVAVIVVFLLAMHPSLLLTNSTTAGGDTGSHVAVAAFMRTNLLPNFHLTGWDPGWYDGFPLFPFYFPFPDLLAALGSYVIPGNIAFKFMTLLGSFTLPVAAWAFGRLAGLERPRPALLAAFTLPFLFDQTYQIYGGNLLSTMAGEYAYSLGLSVALLFLGVVLFGMRTGRLRWAAAVLLAICVVCHLVAAMFALVGVVLIYLLGPPSKRRTWWMISSVGVGALLTAWWWVPFTLQQSFTTSMGYTNVTTFVDILFPQADRWALVLALIGVFAGVLRRQRGVVLLTGLGLSTGSTVQRGGQFSLQQQSRPGDQPDHGEYANQLPHRDRQPEFRRYARDARDHEHDLLGERRDDEQADTQSRRRPTCPCHAAVRRLA